MSEMVRVRFAPSPTGALHIGGGHTALFNWLWARKSKGLFVLRIEDTDLQRSTPEYEQTILDGLRWLGLDWDEGPDKGGPYGPYRQSERLEIYRAFAEELLERGLAYREGQAIVFRVPFGVRVAFNDVVYGPIEMKSETYKDIVLIKSDGMPTYNFAVVVDDHSMEINTVIRGEDHIMNTPKQILLYQAFGWTVPHFAHLPMILGKDKKKLSKRHGATSVSDYAKLGYLPSAVFNFLALLGWSPKNGKEIFFQNEAVELFELEQVTKKPAVFDIDKLNHINQEHIKRLPSMERVEVVMPFWKEMGLPIEQFSREYLAKCLDLLEGRGQTLKEVAEFTDYFIDFGKVTARYDGSDLSEEKKGLLRGFYRKLLDPATEWNVENLERIARDWAENQGVKLKEIAMPLRLALTGCKVSPGIFNVVEFLGREEVRKRLAHYGLV